jgi:hypothetical protein
MICGLFKFQTSYRHLWISLKFKVWRENLLLVCKDNLPLCYGTHMFFRLCLYCGITYWKLLFSHCLPCYMWRCIPMEISLVYIYTWPFCTIDFHALLEYPTSTWTRRPFLHALNKSSTLYNLKLDRNLRDMR